MSSSDTAETYCALEKRRKLPEAVESNSASLVNVCDSQFSFGATRAWSRWTLSSRWGGRWSSSEKSWSWWSSCETWDNTITKLIFCQIWTYNSCLFVSFRSILLYILCSIHMCVLWFRASRADWRWFFLKTWACLSWTESYCVIWPITFGRALSPASMSPHLQWYVINPTYNSSDRCIHPFKLYKAQNMAWLIWLLPIRPHWP